MPQTARGRTVEAAAAIVVAALALFGFIEVPNLVHGWAFVIPGTTDSAMTPAFFPRVAFALLMAFALLVALTTGMRSEPLPILAMQRPNWLRIGILVLMSAVYLWALHMIGFVLASIALMLLLPLLVGYRRPLPILATALLLPPAISVIFWFGLKVALPGPGAPELLSWLQ